MALRVDESLENSNIYGFSGISVQLGTARFSGLGLTTETADRRVLSLAELRRSTLSLVEGRFVVAGKLPRRTSRTVTAVREPFPGRCTAPLPAVFFFYFLNSLIYKRINTERSRFIRYTRPSTSPIIAIQFVRSSMLTLTFGFWLEVAIAVVCCSVWRLTNLSVPTLSTTASARLNARRKSSRLVAHSGGTAALRVGNRYLIRVRRLTTAPACWQHRPPSHSPLSAALPP